MPVNAYPDRTVKRAMLNQGIIFFRLCKNCPSGIDNKSPVIAGMVVSILTINVVAPSRVKKTGRNGFAALASPTPTASI